MAPPENLRAKMDKMKADEKAKLTTTTMFHDESTAKDRGVDLAANNKSMDSYADYCSAFAYPGPDKPFVGKGQVEGKDLFKIKGQAFPYLKKTLAGSVMKVQGLSWAPDHLGHKIISVDQGGYAIVWDVKNQCKMKVMPITFQMCGQFHPDGERVMTGGMNNCVSVFKYTENPKESACGAGKVLTGHDGYVSTIRFPTKNEMLTTGGDGEVILWDINTGTPTKRFYGHYGDCSSLRLPKDPSKENPDVFITCSSDKTMRLWDLRLDGGKQVMAFPLVDECNSCALFPNGHMASAGDHGGRVTTFDLRAMGVLRVAKRKNNRIYSLDYSKSGRVLFCGYEDGHLAALDPFNPNPDTPGGKQGQYDYAYKFEAHVNPQCKTKAISCMEVSPDGTALATGSWNQEESHIKIWGPQGVSKRHQNHT